MKPKITGETERLIGVSVIDNNDVEHLIEMETDGRITAHQQDGYPDDASKRTAEGNEHVNQARRCAKWIVYRERGYDTVPSTENPDRILGVLLAIAALETEAFEESFETLRSKVERHYDDGATVELPFADADPDDMIVYQQDVWIQPDPTTLDPPVIEQFEHEIGADSLGTTPTPEIADLDSLAFTIEAVSGIHTLHTDGKGNEQIDQVRRPLDREPDATIEIVPFDPGEIESFQRYLVSHLAYQVRDCFLLMGVEPPVPFRATGWGKYRAFHVQKFCPQYEEYWSPDASIQSWQPR